jgi:hypothetical protein
MRQLRLVGLAEDGASVELETPTGEAFRLPVDDRLRAACRGDLTRLGQIEIEMESPLRPREIQARVRAGESAEQVAVAAGMPLDRVMRFAYPVLQERQRVVAQARATPMRRGGETLAERVEERLVGRGTDPATLRWDAWRREDGRWTVRLVWRHAAEHAATWTLDLGRRTVEPDDPAAEQLSAEEFHARTVTAVTPLAAATRVARPEARAGGHQPPRAVPDPGRPGATPPGVAAGAPAGASPEGGRAAGRGADAPDRLAGGATGVRRPGAGGGPSGAATRAGQPAGGPDRVRPAAGRSGGGSVQAVPGSRATGGAGAAEPDDGSVPAGRSARRDAAAQGGRREGGPDGPDAADDGPVQPQRRVAAGGGGDAPVDTDDDRSRRASVPSWDDILLGVRRRH